jgi:4-aminobutyrate aminotransferase/(S)-3-amino-2-methylpropionate transaminase
MMYPTCGRCAVRTLKRAHPVGFVSYNTTRCISSSKFIPNEPLPQIKTSIPGPNSKKILTELSSVFDTHNVNMVTNFKKSIGN